MKNIYKFIIAFLTITALTACQTGGIIMEDQGSSDFEPKIFNANDYIPINAVLNSIIALDTNNDGISENAIYYTDHYRIDGISNTIPRDNLEIFRLKKDGWVKEYGFNYSLDNLGLSEAENKTPIEIKIIENIINKGGLKFKKVDAVDIAEDGKKEIFILFELQYGDLPLNDYKIVATENNKIVEMKIPNGMENIPVIFNASRVDATIIEGKIIEEINLYCMDNEEICVNFSHELTFDPVANIWTISEPLNIQKNQEVFDRFIEEFENSEKPLPQWVEKYLL